MKTKVLALFLIVVLFSCEKESLKKKPTAQTLNCKLLLAEINEDGEIKSEHYEYNSKDQLIKKCIAFNGQLSGCFDIDYSVPNKVFYIHNDSINNKKDTLFSGTYKNSKLTEFVDYENHVGPQYLKFTYDSISGKLVEMIDSNPPNLKIYSVKTDDQGDPIKLELKYRNTSSVYDLVEVDIVYHQNNNPYHGDLSSEGFLWFFPTKYIKKIDALNAESNRNVRQVTLEATEQDNKKLSTLLSNEDLIEERTYEFSCK